MMAAMMLGSQRWALIQMVVQRSPPSSALGQLTKLQLASRMLPVAGFVCLILAAAFEPLAFSWEALGQPILRLSVPGMAACIVLLTVAELGVVQRTSAVAVQVLATLHQIPVAFVGAVVFHETVSPLSAAGFGMCVVAALVYALARRAEAKSMQAGGAQLASEEHDGADVPPLGELEMRDERWRSLGGGSRKRVGHSWSAVDGADGESVLLGAARALQQLRPGRDQDEEG
ncbi:unnamed protein product, partial [Prorocentrum cordatum]